MQWKDFLHFQRGSKIAVILLLVLIVFTLILNSLFSYRNSSEIILSQNDSLIREFEAFRQTLKERKPTSLEAREEIETDRSYSKKMMPQKNRLPAGAKRGFIERLLIREPKNSLLERLFH